MDRTDSTTPAFTEPESGSHAPDPSVPSEVAAPHDFEAQKRIHQQIRNDPDYDDWEYGTEPLPHEAWRARPTGQDKPPANEESG